MTTKQSAEDVQLEGKCTPAMMVGLADASLLSLGFLHAQKSHKACFSSSKSVRGSGRGPQPVLQTTVRRVAPGQLKSGGGGQHSSMVRELRACQVVDSCTLRSNCYAAAAWLCVPPLQLLATTSRAGGCCCESKRANSARS